ncbi:hypothetical protein D9M68_599000 [compost metagenome]
MGFKIFLDANIVLDYALKRENYAELRTIFKWEESGKVNFYISLSVVHIVNYFLTKYLGQVIAKTTLLKLLQVISVVDGNHDTVLLAIQNNNPDIEDALQYEVAYKNRVDYFMSADKLLKKYADHRLPVVNVSEVLAVFS